MTLLTPWLLFPAILGLLSYGSGLLLERMSGVELHRALRLPAGLALVIVVAQFTTITSTTASLTAPLIVAIAVAGFALAAERRPRRPDVFAAAAGLGTFAAYAAPVVLSGQATFTGYVKLDDTATFLGFTDQLMSHGRDLAGLAPSTYQTMLALNIGQGYPAGTFLPLGIGAKLTGQDPAWVFQPCMAFYAAATALGLYSLLSPLARSRPLRAIATFVAAQAALLYAYALWGGIKELAAAATIALAAALAPTRSGDLQKTRALIPFGVAAAATLGVLSVSGALWIAPLALPGVVAFVRGTRRSVRPAFLALATTAVLAIPALVLARTFLNSYAKGNLLTQSQRLGNLVHPLSFIQIFGIWPTGDFRFTPSSYTFTKILIGVCAVAAAATVAAALRRGVIRLPVAALTCIAAAVILERASSPWLVAKALADASPFIVALALAGAVMLIESGRRTEGAVLAAFLVGGVLWSNVLGYRAAWLAPRSQLAELQAIGQRFAGEGPALMTEYQPYGVRHFLRHLDAEGASELRVRQVPLVDGSTLPKGGSADLDRFRYPDLLVYRTLVLRTSPVESRPSAAYALVWHGRFYDVWQRPASGGLQVLAHLPLGSDDAPAAPAPCAVVRHAAAEAAAQGAVIAVATAVNPILIQLPTAPVVHATVDLPRSGTYQVWIGGRFFRTIEVAVDGHRIGSTGTSDSLYVPLGSAALSAGRHEVTITYSGVGIAPGSAAPVFSIGPLAFSLAGPPPVVTYVEPARAAALCGRPFDWIEVVRP